MAARVLLHSTEQALDNTYACLHDWDIIEKAIHGHKTTAFQRLISNLVSSSFLLQLFPQLRRATLEFQILLKAFVALSYIEAHTFAQAEIPQNIGMDDALDMRVQKQVIHESNLQKQKAADLISRLPPQTVEVAKSEMLARRLLRQECEEIHHMQEAGFLTQAEANHLQEPCLKALREIARVPPNLWSSRFYGITAEPPDLHKDPVPRPEPLAATRQPYRLAHQSQPYLSAAVDPGAALHGGSRIVSTDPGSVLHSGTGQRLDVTGQFGLRGDPHSVPHVTIPSQLAARHIRDQAVTHASEH